MKKYLLSIFSNNIYNLLYICSYNLNAMPLILSKNIFYYYILIHIWMNIYTQLWLLMRKIKYIGTKDFAIELLHDVVLKINFEIILLLIFFLISFIYWKTNSSLQRIMNLWVYILQRSFFYKTKSTFSSSEYF